MPTYAINSSVQRTFSTHRFTLVATLLFATMLQCPPAVSKQSGMEFSDDEQLKAAHGELVGCGQRAVQADPRIWPQGVKEAKALLGTHCMRQFNDFMSLVTSVDARAVEADEANDRFTLAAIELVNRENSARNARTHEPLAKQPPAPLAQKAATQSCKGSVKKGLTAYNAGKFEEALCHWLPKARRGDASAQNNMGLLFERGLSVQTPQSDDEAARWFLLAAQQGLSLAMRNLAIVQTRMGHKDAAGSWIQLADTTDHQNKAVRDQQEALGIGLLLGGVACAVGGCTTPGVGYSTPAPSIGYAPVGRSGRDRAGLLADEDGLGESSRARPADRGLGSIRLDVSARDRSARDIRMCADGSYISGTCNMAPDGTYVGGRPNIAPDGTYVGGTPRLAPDGSYVGGTGRTIMCPDGTYVVGNSCRLTPSGTYVGQ